MAQADWQVYRSNEGRYSVQLPEAPAKASQNLRANTANNVLALKTSDGSYMVSYVDSDGFDDDRNKIEAILDNACRGAATNAGATTLRAEPLIRNGFVGRSVRFRGRDGTQYRGLVFLAGTRLYQVYASGEASWVAGKDVDRFLNSFRMWK
jgi:hypothetical protein